MFAGGVWCDDQPYGGWTGSDQLLAVFAGGVWCDDQPYGGGRGVINFWQCLRAACGVMTNHTVGRRGVIRLLCSVCGMWCDDQPYGGWTGSDQLLAVFAGGVWCDDQPSRGVGAGKLGFEPQTDLLPH